MDPLTASIEANWSEFLTLLSEVMQIASVKVSRRLMRLMAQDHEKC